MNKTVVQTAPVADSSFLPLDYCEQAQIDDIELAATVSAPAREESDVFKQVTATAKQSTLALKSIQASAKQRQKTHAKDGDQEANYLLYRLVDICAAASRAIHHQSAVTLNTHRAAIQHAAYALWAASVELDRAIHILFLSPQTDT